MLRNNVAIDLGTANVLVYVQGRGIVIREPSVVAVRSDSRREVLAVGEEAKQMLGRTPGDIVAVRPLRDGVIADFDVTEAMLRYFLNKALQKRSLFTLAPYVVICVPCGVTDVEKRAVKDATLRAGAWDALIAEEPMAAAIGAGMPVAEPCGNMVVDIGGGTSEVAVMSLGGIVVAESLRVGGVKMDEDIQAYVKRAYNLLIGERTAEEIKINIGSAVETRHITSMEIRGRDLTNGLPVTVEITSDEVREALRESVDAIIEAIKSTLEKTPPELAADIMERGIMLTGGGALLQGLDILIYHETGISAVASDRALDCVALGAGRIVEEYETLRRSQRKSRANR
jgi:rod shape-determining protein MreB